MGEASGSRPRRLIKGTGAGFLLLAFAVLAIVLFFPAGKLGSWLGKSGSDRFGREFAIEGPLAIDWHWTTPVIRAQDIRLANREGAPEPDMLRIEAAEIAVKIWPLLIGRIELPHVTLTRPQLVLEQIDKDTANWDLPAASEGKAVEEAVVPEERSEFPVIGLLEIHEGTLKYRNAPRGLELDLSLDTAVGEGGAERRFTVSGTGSLEGRAFNLNARGGSLEMLRESEKPWPLAADLTMGATRVRASGTFTDPLQLRGIDVNLQVEGNNLADLFYLTGVPLPLSPPYRLAGRMVREKTVWSSDHFEGVVGDSDLSGNFAYDTKGEPNFLKAELHSKLLDLDDLGGLLGFTPGTGEGETAAPEQQEEAQRRERAPRLLPDVPINLERLRAANLDVLFRAEQIEAPGWPFKGMDSRILLENGLLRFDPLHFDLADGSGAGMIVLDGRTDTPGVSARLDLRRISLGRFFDGTRFAETTQGHFGSHIELEGQGLSLAEVLGVSDGQVVATMSGGRISLLLLEAADIDIAEAAPLLLGDDASAYIRCGVADFAVRDGVLRSNVFVLDTTDTNIQADVTLDLQNEIIDARAQAHTKDPSILAVQSPILITGRLKSPDIGLDPAEAGARAGAAALLGAVLTPLAALIPFIELGLGEDSECGALIEQARASAARPIESQPSN